MADKKELTNNTFTKDILAETTFFMFAEGGAMGEPGGIIFLTESGTVYHANYCFGDLKWDTVKEAFPIIDNCRFGLFGIGTEVPDGWLYVNLGMGNHLIVRQDRYSKFAPLISEYKSPGQIYQNWLEKALSVN